MQRDLTAVGRLSQPIKELATDHPIPERAPLGLESFVAALPSEILYVNADHPWFQQSGFDGPRSSAFERRVSDVETNADVCGVEIAHEFEDVPHGAADHPGAAVILQASTDAELA